MEWMMIAFGLLYVASFIWNILTNNRDTKSFSIFLLTISAVILFALFLSYENKNRPTAKDVYEGKTTIEITYKDSIPVDSVVVFKDKFKK